MITLMLLRQKLYCARKMDVKINKEFERKYERTADGTEELLVVEIFVSPGILVRCVIQNFGIMYFKILSLPV